MATAGAAEGVEQLSSGRGLETALGEDVAMTQAQPHIRPITKAADQPTSNSPPRNITQVRLSKKARHLARG